MECPDRRQCIRVLLHHPHQRHSRRGGLHHKRSAVHGRAGRDSLRGRPPPASRRATTPTKSATPTWTSGPRILDVFVDMGAYESAWPYIAVTSPTRPTWPTPPTPATWPARTTTTSRAGGRQSLTAGGQGDLAVSWEGWSGSAGGLQVGPNTIEVYGTNQWGESDSDSITIIRAAKAHYVATNGGHVSPYTNWVTRPPTSRRRWTWPGMAFAGGPGEQRRLQHRRTGGVGVVADEPRMHQNAPK